MAVVILGPRKGRFYDSRGRPFVVPRSFPGHSVALQLMGTMVLWFGWFGFNPGSALLLTAPRSKGAVAGLVAVNTAIAGGTGAISALFANMFLEERRTGEYAFDLTMAMNGCLIGLVSITAPCGTVYNWAALVIGMVGGFIYIGASKMLIKLRIDDAVDAIPVHLFGGAWGVLSVGLFTAPRLILEAFGTDDHVGLFYSIGQSNIDFTLLGLQFVELLFIVGWSVGIMLPFFLLLNYVGWFRVDSLEETVGLDTSYNLASGAARDDDVKDSDVQALIARKAANANKRRTANGHVNTDDDRSWSQITMTRRPPVENEAGEGPLSPRSASPLTQPHRSSSFDPNDDESQDIGVASN